MGHAYGALYSLIIRYLESRYPDDWLGKAGDFDAFDSAGIEPGLKSELLDRALSYTSASEIARIGQEVRSMRSAPPLRALLNSSNSDVLAQKWLRLESYYHATNRTRIIVDAPNSWICERFTIDGGVPRPAENLFIFGVLRSVLILYGAGDLEARIGEAIFDGRRFDRPVPTSAERTVRWTFEWRREAAAPQVTDAASFGADIESRLAQLLRSDVSRAWRLSAAANLLGVSGRSLQREIAATGHTFSSVLRWVRIEAASRMLSETDFSIGDIGYCCGYADQAHFQRDFKRLVNMTPRAYRKISG